MNTNNKNSNEPNESDLVELALELDGTRDALCGKLVAGPDGMVHVYEVVPSEEATQLDDMALLLAKAAVMVHSMTPAYRAVLQDAYRRHLAHLAPGVDFGAS